MQLVSWHLQSSLLTNIHLMAWNLLLFANSVVLFRHASVVWLVADFRSDGNWMGWELAFRYSCGGIVTIHASANALELLTHLPTNPSIYTVHYVRDGDGFHLAWFCFSHNMRPVQVNEVTYASREIILKEVVLNQTKRQLNRNSVYISRGAL